jgi:hypothetical protein
MRSNTQGFVGRNFFKEWFLDPTRCVTTMGVILRDDGGGYKTSLEKWFNGR